MGKSSRITYTRKIRNVYKVSLGIPPEKIPT
jgi:hypothetical protein